MISKEDQRRIRNDAYIACDALEGLMYADALHPEYIKEKIDTVQRCVDFIRHFAGDGKGGRK